MQQKLCSKGLWIRRQRKSPCSGVSGTGGSVCLRSVRLISAFGYVVGDDGLVNKQILAGSQIPLELRTGVKDVLEAGGSAEYAAV